MATKHLSTEWEQKGQAAAVEFFDARPNMSRQLLFEIARGAKYQANLDTDITKHHWADGFYNILTTLSLTRAQTFFDLRHGTSGRGERDYQE